MRTAIGAIIVAIGLMLGSASQAAADVGDFYHPQGSACGQYHGAFEYYRAAQGAWIPGAAQDGGLGDTTGPANSAKGCQPHF